VDSCSEDLPLEGYVHISFSWTEPDLENREYGSRDPSHWPRGTLYPQKVGTSFADKRRSLAGIVRSRTKATELLVIIIVLHIRIPKCSLMLSSYQYLGILTILFPSGFQKPCIHSYSSSLVLHVQPILSSRKNKTFCEEIVTYVPFM
jgi:hypothetical protein